MNLWLSLILNVAVPSLILAKLTHFFGPMQTLCIALAFPISCTLYELKSQKKPSWITVLGLLNVMLTGGLGLVQADLMWFAVKEAAIPSAIACVMLVSAWMKRSLVLELLLNPQLVDWAQIRDRLKLSARESDFERLVQRATYAFSGSFFLSAALNFGLARWILHSPPGSEEFNTELARMHVLSWPVIALPSTLCAFLTLIYFFKGIEKLTGLTAEEILTHGKKTSPQ